MQTSEPKRFRTLALPVSLLETARERARASGTTRNAVVLDALRRFLDALRSRHGA
jgi:hypothetical protein